MDIDEIKGILNKYDITPTKKKGQNFLVDTSVLDKMIEAARVDNKDIVLEIGPGLGILTERLAQKADKVLAIELDKKIAQVLKENILPAHRNVTLIEGDVLSQKTFHKMIEWLVHQKDNRLIVNPKDESYRELLESFDGSYKLVANLPYQITSKVLRQFLESMPRPSQIVVMVQKEVAERMSAPPGKMSLLSLAVQAYCTPKIIAVVPSSAFFPEPAVNSAIIHCDLTKPNEEYSKLSNAEQKWFWRLAKAGFSSRRKQLQNNLQRIIKNSTPIEVLASLDLSEKSRAQELSVKDWCRLAQQTLNE